MRDVGRLVMLLVVDVRKLSVWSKTFVKQDRHSHSIEVFSSWTGAEDTPLGGETDTK